MEASCSSSGLRCWLFMPEGPPAVPRRLDRRAAKIDHAAIFAPAAEGSGRLQTSSATSSSTRAEAHGILCGAILASYTQSDLTWYCDSKAAIQTYRKLDKLTEAQWLQLGNTVVVPKPYKKEELGITTATSWDGKDVRRSI